MDCAHQCTKGLAPSEDLRSPRPWYVQDGVMRKITRLNACKMQRDAQNSAIECMQKAIRYAKQRDALDNASAQDSAMRKIARWNACKMQ